MLIWSEEPNIAYRFADQKLDTESNATICVYSQWLVETVLN